MTDWTAQAREVYGRMGRAEATFPPGQAEIDIDILAAALERAATEYPAPGRRVVGRPETLRDDLTWDRAERHMEFRLTYEGPLLASNAGERDTKPARKEYKHGLRQQFHHQIKKVFELTPFLNTGTPSGPALDGAVETYLPKYNKDAVAAKHQMYGWTFLPLVTEELRLSCWIDVLFLRRQPRGSVWQHGDIDNRLKTLFDALQIPDANQGYEKMTPGVGETPFYCLLENDNLISKVTVETDQLLQNLQTPPDQSDARLIITVRIQPYEFTF